MRVCKCMRGAGRERERESSCVSPQRKATGEEQLRHNMKTEEERGTKSQELRAPGCLSQ